MKKILLAAASALFMFATYAQDCASYVPNKEGAVFETTSYDKKGKSSSMSKSKIVSIKNEGGKKIYNVSSTTNTGGQSFSMDYDMICDKGQFSVNMKNLYGSQLTGQFQGMKTDITADNLVYPSSMSVGQSLEDASIKISANIEGMPVAMAGMGITMEIKNRKVSAKESVTTPAGTFNCYKIEYDIESKTIVAVSIQACEWIAENVGVVKSENYDSKGQVESYTLLTALK